MDAIAICDDCAEDRRYLEHRIRKNWEAQSDMEIYQYSSGRQLLEAMEDIRFSAIFLDIMMAGMDGEETAGKIRERDCTLLLAFFTGYAHPTPNSFLTQPYRYILKTMPDHEINQQISDVLIKMKADRNILALVVTAGGSEISIRLESVVYIEKCKRGLGVNITESAKHLLEKEYFKEKLPELRMSNKLNTVYENIKSYGFGRPHDSYVVNYRHVAYCTNEMLQMAGMSGYLGIADSKRKEFLRHKDIFVCSKYGKGGVV